MSTYVLCHGAFAGGWRWRERGIVSVLAAAGHQAEENLHAAVKKYEGQFICVVEGSVATKFDGGYGKVAGRTFLDIAKDVVPKAAATIAIGIAPLLMRWIFFLQDFKLLCCRAILR